VVPALRSFFPLEVILSAKPAVVQTFVYYSVAGKPLTGRRASGIMPSAAEGMSSGMEESSRKFAQKDRVIMFHGPACPYFGVPELSDKYAQSP